MGERDNINENDIYAISLNGKEYYHLKELEDGDFIGIDKDNKIYKITHDPYMIQELERTTLINYLKQE